MFKIQNPYAKLIGIPGCIVGQLGHVKGFVDDTLSGKGCVAMEQDRHDLLALGVSPVELLGPHLALHNGVDGLQVGRVGDDGHANVLVRDSVKAFNVSAQVVFDIARSLVGGLEAGELRQELVEGLATNVGEDVETASMGHADHEGLDAGVGRLVDDFFHSRDHHLDSLEAEALLGAVLLGEEVLEAGRARDASQKQPLVVGAHEHATGSLQLLPDPVDL